MIYLFALFISPLLIGMLLLTRSANKTHTGILLFHHLTHRFPRSLSEFPIAKFTRFIDQFRSKKISLVTIAERESTFDSRLSIIFDDGFRSNLEAAKILHNNNLKASFFICTAHLNGEAITDVYQSNERLSAKEIVEIAQLGHEIGSHTVHHYDLRLLSQNDLIYELSESKRTLELLIGKEVTSLSIPYGLWDDNVISIAQMCGYSTIVVYNFPKQALKHNRVFPVTGVYPFDSVSDLFQKFNRGVSVSSAMAKIIPQFAKGSPLGAFQSIYRIFPLPWFMNRKQKNHSNNKEY